MCRRTDSSCNTQKSKSINNNLQDEDFKSPFSSSILEQTVKLSTNEYLQENDYKLPYQESPTDTFNTKSNNLLNEPNNYCISNIKNSPQKYKMQCKNDLKDFNQDCKLLNVSASIETSPSNSRNVLKVQNDSFDSTSKVSPFRNLFSPSKINNFEKESPDLPIESLSQGTRNFLIELAASKTIKTASESGYALSTINSPFSRKNKKAEIATDSVESKTVSECTDISVSNNEGVSESIDSSITTEKNVADLSFLITESMSAASNKDVNGSDAENVSVLSDQVVSLLDPIHTHVQIEETVSVSNDLITGNGDVNSLDLIEQSSLHDKEMPSVEITDNGDVVNSLDLIEQSSLHDKEMPSVEIADNGDVVNSLDLIEQSSLHDKEMPSAEICSSLNQIFSDANVVFSTTADSNSETNQVIETGMDYETITFQTVGTDGANFETNTINLADLYNADNSELCQRIVLVQDESGNIETVLLLPQDAQVVESIPSYEIGSAESVPLLVDNSENINTQTEIQTEQCVFINNISTDKALAEVQDASIMHEALDSVKDILTLDSNNEQPKADLKDSVTNQEDCIINQVLSSQKPLVVGHNNFETKERTLDSIKEQEHKADLDDCVITEVLLPQRNSVTNHNNLEMKKIEEENGNARKNIAQFKDCILIDQKNDSVKMSSSHKSAVCMIKDDASKNKILAQDEILNNKQNGQNFLIKHSDNSISNSIGMQSMASNTVKCGFEEFSVTVNSHDSTRVSLLKSSLNNTDTSLKSVNEHEKRSSSLASNFVNTLILNAKNKFPVANISNSKHLTNVNFSSKAKKQLSINGTNFKSVQFDQHISPSSNDAMSIKTRDTPILTPLNGSVYHSQSNSAVGHNHQFHDASNAKKSIQSEILIKSVQKSKKTFTPKLNNRTAKKTVSVSKENVDLSQVYQLLRNSDYKSFGELIDNDENFIQARNLLLKRGLEDEVSLLKRKKNSHPENVFNNEVVELHNVPESQTRSVALKTFIQPFTAAKKSAFDNRRKAKNTALKTCMSRGFNVKNTALKSFPQKQISEKTRQLAFKDNFKKVIAEAKQQNSHILSETCFQPQVCEIRILPNDYVKRASDVLLKTNSAERPCTAEENAWEEEIKLPPESISPIEELMIPKIHCICAEKEIPCLCYDDKLQRICEAEDTFDDKVVPCTNHVSQHYLHTPSSEIKHRAFCDIHLWRLRRHHCCPKCGIFCSQGDFLLCSFEDLEKKENHLFHTSCFIIPSPGLPPSCPHCCQFSSFVPVNLIYRSASDKEKTEVPSSAQNITSDINEYDIYLKIKEGIIPNQSVDSNSYVPQKNMTQLMIRSLAKENSLRLRPTAKCLYNPIKTGDVQKVMQLIGNGVNPNHKFKMHGNNAPLHVAAHCGWTGILHILLQAGAYIDSVNDDLETPLIVAVEKKQLPIVRYLISAGAQIDVKDCNGMTSFHIASKNGFREIAEFLYSTGNIDVNLQDDGGWTALVWACEHKHVDFVRWLLEIGADPNVRDNEGNTVLHWAAYSGKCEIAELLLDKGCTLSYVNKRGDSALHIAAREDNYECIKLFINRGAVVDQKNKENKTPLMCCEDDSLSFNYLCQSISSGVLKIGKLLLEKHVVFRDISRGAEAYPIQAINEVDDEEFIMEFRYVVKQCHRSGVNINSTVDSMQICYCKDNCVTRDCNCLMNSKCWYDANGCLTSEYDLQSSPIIFECNKTCHCPKTCINRVVQQGLKFPLQIFRTRYKGWGVRTLQDIPKGAFVCEYVGELITGTEATQRSDDTYLFDLESQGSDYCLDGRYYGNVARFLNHSCEPNLIALKVFVDHQDMNFPRIAFFAYKEIRAFEELCFDYGLDFWIVKCQTILCVCNTQSCKYSKDTIDDTLWRFFMDTENGEQLNCAS